MARPTLQAQVMVTKLQILALTGEHGRGLFPLR